MVSISGLISRYAVSILAWHDYCLGVLPKFQKLWFSPAIGGSKYWPVRSLIISSLDNFGTPSEWENSAGVNGVMTGGNFFWLSSSGWILLGEKPKPNQLDLRQKFSGRS